MFVKMNRKENGSLSATISVAGEVVTLIPHRNDDYLAECQDGDEVEVMIINGLRNHPRGFLITAVAEDHKRVGLFGFYANEDGRIVSKDTEGNEYGIGHFASLLPISNNETQPLTPVVGFVNEEGTVLRGLSDVTPGLLLKKQRMFEKYKAQQR